jgi:hypothetical protein
MADLNEILASANTQRGFEGSLQPGQAPAHRGRSRDSRRQPRRCRAKDEDQGVRKTSFFGP